MLFYYYDFSRSLHEYKGRELQELVQMSGGIRGEYNRHPGNTTENSGVAAEAAELKGGWVALVASLQLLFVLSYSGLSLLSLQSL